MLVAPSTAPGMGVLHRAESGSWYGLMAPRGIPDDVRTRLTATVTKVLAMPDVNSKIAATGLDPITLTGNEFQDYLRQQWESTGRVIRTLRKIPN